MTSQKENEVGAHPPAEQSKFHVGVTSPAGVVYNPSPHRGFESTTSTVLALPSATPKDIVQKVRDALLVVLDQPRTRQTFEKVGGEVVKSTPEEYVRRMQEEHARWVRIRKETGIRVE